MLQNIIRKGALGTLAITAMAATPSAGSVSNTIHLRAHVPIYCNVDLVATPTITPLNGVVSLGMSQEFCNSPRGYRIILQHPTDMAGAAALSDAYRIPLSQSGETVLSDSDQPGFHLRQLALDLGNDPAAIYRLGLRIEVKY